MQAPITYIGRLNCFVTVLPNRRRVCQYLAASAPPQNVTQPLPLYPTTQSYSSVCRFLSLPHQHQLSKAITMPSDLDQLIDMGFEKARAEIAVKKSGGSMFVAAAATTPTPLSIRSSTG